MSDCAFGQKAFADVRFGAELEMYRAILNTMVVLRHLVGSDPSIEFADEDCIGNAAVTLHFDPRPPKAAVSIEQDKRSVVITDAPYPKLPGAGDPADVTQVTRPRGVARWFTLNHWIILFETNWILLTVGLSVLVLLVCAVRLRHM